MIASVRPSSWDFPLFLHVAGAITLFGVVVAVLLLAVSGSKRPDSDVLARSAFTSLLVGAVPAWVLMRAGAQWTYSKEPFNGHNDPTWIGIGFGVSDAGLLVLLILLAVAYRWRGHPATWLPRTAAALSGVYLALLAIAWLAMSGKWG